MSKEAMTLALEDICGAKLCEINSMSSRQEMLRLMDSAITSLRQAIDAAEQHTEADPSRSDIKQEQRSVSEHTGEPVAECVDDGEGGVYYKTLAPKAVLGKLYATPYVPTGRQQRIAERKPLTGKQIALIGAKWHFNLLDKTGLQELYEYTRAIEAAHGIHPSDFKEKNT